MTGNHDRLAVYAMGAISTIDAENLSGAGRQALKDAMKELERLGIVRSINGSRPRRTTVGAGDRAEALVLAHPTMSARALAQTGCGISSGTINRVQRRLRIEGKIPRLRAAKKVQSPRPMANLFNDSEEN